MPGINLAPGSQYVLALRKRRRKLFALSFLAILALGGIWGALYSRLNKLEQQRDDIHNQIRQVQLAIAELSDSAGRVVLFEHRLSSMDALLNGHAKWDAVFGDLERLLPPPTVLRTISIDTEGQKIEIEGVTQDVDLVAQTLSSLADSDEHNTVFTSVQFDQVARNEIKTQEAEGIPSTTLVSYSFSANLTFDASRVRSSQR